MPAWQKRYFVACSSVIGFCIAYALCDFARWPRLTYFPYERTWKMVADPGSSVPSAYVGMVLWGAGGAVVGGVGAWLAARLLGREVSARSTGLFGAWALSAFALAGLYFTWGLWPF